MCALTGTSGVARVTEVMSCQFDQRVSKAPVAKPAVVGPSTPSQWFEGSPKRRAANCIQEAPQHDGPSLAGQKLDRPRLHRVNLFPEELPGVGGVARMRAVVAEAAHRVFQRTSKQRRLIEVAAGRGLAYGAGATGKQREVGESDPAFSHRFYRGRESICLLPDGHGVGRRSRGHTALVTDPSDRAHRTLPFVLLGGREIGGDRGELELQEVGDVPEADQLLAELLRLPTISRAPSQAFDSCLERRQGLAIARGITHSCIISNICSTVQPQVWFRYSRGQPHMAESLLRSR